MSSAAPVGVAQVCLHQSMTDELKTCTVCHQKKLLAEYFFRNKAGKRFARCKTCMIEQGRKRKAKKYIPSGHVLNGIRRREALHRGAIKFISVRPCKRCGDVYRYTQKSDCVTCNKTSAAKRYGTPKRLEWLCVYFGTEAYKQSIQRKLLRARERDRKRRESCDDRYVKSVLNRKTNIVVEYPEILLDAKRLHIQLLREIKNEKCRRTS